MSTINHEAAREFAEFHQEFDMLPRQQNISRAYLDLAAQLQAERQLVDRLVGLVKLAFYDQRCGNDAAWEQSLAHKKLSEIMEVRDNG